MDSLGWPTIHLPKTLGNINYATQAEFFAPVAHMHSYFQMVNPAEI